MSFHPTSVRRTLDFGPILRPYMQIPGTVPVDELVWLITKTLWLVSRCRPISYIWQQVSQWFDIGLSRLTEYNPM